MYGWNTNWSLENIIDLSRDNLYEVCVCLTLYCLDDWSKTSLQAIIWLLRLVAKMEEPYYGLKLFLGHKRRKHIIFVKARPGPLCTLWRNTQRAFQQVPYEKLSQRTFLFLVMLPRSTYLRYFYNEEDDWNQLPGVHTHSTFEQFDPRIHPKPKVLNRKKKFLFVLKIFKLAFLLKENVFIIGSSFDQVSLLVLSSLLLLLLISLSTAVVSEMLISALDFLALPSSMLAYCCSLLSAADFSMMSFSISLLPALLSMVSFSYEWEVWSASLVLQFWTPSIVLTVLHPWFEIPPLVLIFLP